MNLGARLGIFPFARARLAGLRTLGGLAALLLAGGFISAAESAAKLPRLTVAVLAFEDQTREPEASHWGHSLAAMLRGQLAEVKAVRLLTRGTMDFAAQQLSLESGDSLTADQARRIGERIEVRRVVWGSYRRDGAKWQVTARVLNAAGGKTSADLKAASSDWFDARDQLTAQILDELGVKLSREERQQLARRPTKSAAAWELYSRACALRAERKPWPDQEAALRQAIAADPGFAEARLDLAAALASQGQFGLAQEAAREALRLRPDLPAARPWLGSILIAQGKIDEAEKELSAARRRDPEDASVLAQLGEVRLLQDRADEALACWKEAVALDPASALVHAQLGQAYVRQGQRVLALLELKDAEQFNPGDADTEEILARTYDALHDTLSALEHCERFVALARKQGGQPARVRQFEARADELKATLTSHDVAAVMPKVVTEESLTAMLRERLTADEWKLVAYPLASTPDMKRVADTLVLGAPNDFEKAKKLFTALARHLDPGAGGSRTAREVFEGWNDPRLSFRCQEYARFYVALARDAGLSAFFTLVEKNQEGMAAPHACACVFAGGKAWLADPSSGWFGVPHQSFTVLDDLQALVVFLHQQEGDIPRRRLAVKLQPDSAMAQFNLAMSLMSARQLDEARAVLDAGLRLEPDSWMAHCAQGYFAGWQGQWAQAEAHLRKAIALNPDYDKTYFFLAEALRQGGRLPEAREEYRAFLRRQLEPQFTDAARRALAQINEKLGTE